MVNSWLRRIGIVAVGAIVLLVIGQVALAADPKSGLPIYEKNACAACHGTRGEGGMGPALRGAAFASEFPTAENLIDIVRKGTAKGMPPYAEDKISIDDMDSLVAYIQTFDLPESSVAPKDTTAEKAASEKGAEDARNGYTMEQMYAIVIAAIALFLMLLFAVVLNGPLRMANTSRRR